MRCTTVGIDVLNGMDTLGGIGCTWWDGLILVGNDGKRYSKWDGMLLVDGIDMVGWDALNGMGCS